MYTRYLTYDLNNADSCDYLDLYGLLDEYKAIKITESTYLIETEDTWDTFKSNFYNVTKIGDKVYAIVKKDGIEHWTIRE